MEYPEPNWGGWWGNKRRKKWITDLLFFFFFWNSHSSSYAKAEFKNCFIIYLRTFAPIATAIFSRMSRTRHASQTRKVKHDTKGANIFHKNGTWKQVAWWDSCVPRSSRKCHAMTWQCEYTIAKRTSQGFYSWMLGDPYFSFRRSLPFLILCILTKNKSVREKLQIFRLLCSRATEVFFLRLICIVFQGLFRLKKDISCKG